MNKSISSLLLLLGLAVSAVVAWLLFGREKPAAPPAQRPGFVLPVTLGSVRTGDLAPHAELTGSVVATTRSNIGFEVAARVATIDVEEGQLVEQGALLATVDARDAAAALARAKATVELAQRQLELVLSGERDETKRRLEAELAVRMAEAELARKEAERGAELVRSNVVSQSSLDALAAARATAEARVKSAEETLAQARAGSRAEDVAVQRAQLELRKAELAVAQREVEKCEIRAPFPAAIVRRIASVGDSLAAGSPVLEIVDRSRREIAIEIPSGIAARVGPKPRMRVSIVELRDFELETQLDAFIPVADEQSRVFRGLARLEPAEDKAGVLKPGMFVRVRLELEPLRGVRIVPSDAVRVVGAGTLVVRAKAGKGEDGNPNLTAEFVPVRVLGAQSGESAVEALAGELAAGDSIVVSGSDMAFPGAPLLPRSLPAAESKP
ncbi:MAG: HlyD family efflux transporter periplasmic adaptor subunit [Planctomycetota bacterium]|nr:HlyD family efflux transporter periplasmic adaptor subunit [Planctomycetota bacterium]